MKNNLIANAVADNAVEVARVVVPQKPQMSLFAALEIPEDAFMSIRKRRIPSQTRKKDDSGTVVRGFAAYLMKQGRRNKFTSRTREESVNDLAWSDEAIVKLHRALLEDCERSYKSANIKGKFSYLSWMLGDPKQEYSFYSCLVMEGMNPNIAIDAVEATAPDWFKHIVETNMPYEDIPSYLATVKEDEATEVEAASVTEEDSSDDFASASWTRPISFDDGDNDDFSCADDAICLAEFEDCQVLMA